MADEREQANTHITDLVLVFRTDTVTPEDGVAGDMFFNPATGDLCRYTGDNWLSVTFV